MAVSIGREGWLPLFTQTRAPNRFLSRFFTVKPGGIYDGEKVALDIEREGEDVAVVIKKSTGPNLNDFDQFTTKEFEPPAYGEGFPLNVNELLNRMAGVDPYSAAYTGYASDLMAKMLRGFNLVNNKIIRAVELQASQILLTGKLVLTDKNGSTVYSLDFKPKVTHFPNAGTTWATSTTKLADLESLANVIRSDGKVDPNILIFADNSFNYFIGDDTVKARLDNRRMELSEIRPKMVDSGATYQGNIWLGNYRFEMFTYPETYKHPQTAAVTRYVPDDKVIMLSDRTRLDMTAARVPLPLGPDPRVANLLPGRMSSPADGFDVTPNVYASLNGKEIMGELESRPLLIPVQIDGFGCLDITP